MVLIAQLATQFRAAIEATPWNELPLEMKDFPLGACGDAALLLARFLGDHGLGAFDYMSGKRDCRHSHAWLQRDDLIVDITGDQFIDMQQRVFVGTDSARHAQFDAECLHVADISLFDDATRTKLENVYHQIVARLAPT